jgi:hypothetical protein
MSREHSLQRGMEGEQRPTRVYCKGSGSSAAGLGSIDRSLRIFHSIPLPVFILVPVLHHFRRSLSCILLDSHVFPGSFSFVLSFLPQRSFFPPFSPVFHSLDPLHSHLLHPSHRPSLLYSLSLILWQGQSPCYHSEFCPEYSRFN